MAETHHSPPTIFVSGLRCIFMRFDPGSSLLRQHSDHFNDFPVRNIRRIGKLLPVLVPHSPQLRAFFEITQNRRCIRDLSRSATVLGRCGQGLHKHSFVKFLRSRQNIGIVEVSGPGIEHTAAQNGLHLFRHHGLDNEVRNENSSLSGDFMFSVLISQTSTTFSLS